MFLRNYADVLVKILWKRLGRWRKKRKRSIADEIASMNVLAFPETALTSLANLKSNSSQA
jgi:hypothetical protein